MANLARTQTDAAFKRPPQRPPFFDGFLQIRLAFRKLLRHIGVVLHCLSGHLIDIARALLQELRDLAAKFVHVLVGLRGLW